MSFIFTRNIILSMLMVLIILFLLISNRSSYSFLFVSRLKNNNSPQLSISRTFTSNTRRVVKSSSNNKQFSMLSDESSLVRLYLDVVRDTVCGLTLRTQESSVVPGSQAEKVPFNIAQRIVGEDWPLIGITMIGKKRLTNIEWALRRVIAKNVPGDFIECGVWRGGGSIFARAILKALNINDRHVWLADSFAGLPKARTANDNDGWSQQEYLKVSLEEVQTNFRSFHLLDDHVHFCKGYFVNSLPRCAVSKISVLRMDGDMYESTMDQLFNLYSKIQIGGVIIVDDYNIAECVRAINNFRDWHNITEKIVKIRGDNSGIYWIKKKMVKIQMDRYKPLLVSTV